MTTGRKKRLRILEDTDEEQESSSSDGDSVVEVVAPPPKPKVSTPVQQQQRPTPPSSASSFRLTRRAPRSSATTKKKTATVPAAKAKPKAKTTRKRLLSTSSSFSSSSSSDSEDDNNDKRKKISQTSRSRRTGKPPLNSKRPTDKKDVPTKSKATLAEDSDSSDSDSDDVVVEVKGTVTKAASHAATLSRSSNSRTANHLDSDSDGSSIPDDPLAKARTRIPAAAKSTTTNNKTVTRPALLLQRKPPAQPTKRNPPVQPKTRNPPVQPTKRNLPAQPKGRTTGTGTTTNRTTRKRSLDESPGGSSTTSNESSIMAQMARKCKALREAQVAAEAEEDEQAVEEEDLVNGLAKGGNDVTSRNSSVFESEPPHHQEKNTQSARNGSRSRLDNTSNNKSPPSDKTSINTKSGEEQGDLSDEQNDDAENDDDDGDSVDTVELNKRLRTSLGLPIRPKDVTVVEKPVAEETPPDEPPREDEQQPTTNEAAQDEDEFILPPCDSSSSSSSSAASSDNCNRTGTGTGSLSAAPIPSVIGVAITNLPRNESNPTRDHVFKAGAIQQPSHIAPAQGNRTNIASFPQPGHIAAPTINPYHRKAAPPTIQLKAPPKSPPKPEIDENVGHHQNQHIQRSPNEVATEELEEMFFEDNIAVLQASSSSHTGGHSFHNESDHGIAARQMQDQGDLQQLENEAFFGDGIGDRPKPNSEVVDLCLDDDDDEEEEDHNCHRKLPAASTIIHHGLRGPPQNPMINRQPQSFSSYRSQAVTATDDIDYFSDDDAQPPSHMRPRRVTDFPNVKPTKANFQPTISSADYDPYNNAPVQVPQSRNNPSSRASLSQFRTNLPKESQQQPQAAKRRRIRDPTNSNPFNARSIARKPGSQYFEETQPTEQGQILPTKDKSVFYRQQPSTIPAFQHFSSQQQPVRNDLAGGSGVGAGGYRFEHSYDDTENCDDNDYHYNQASNGRKRKATSGRGRKTSSSSRSKGGAKSKRGNYRGRGGWGGKRGGRGGRGRGRSGGRGGGRRNYGSGVVMESQNDPLLSGIGGADISF